MTDLSELKERIKLSNSIEEIVREAVPLGPHNKALCPFHKEDTPSFFVNVKEQYFHCFGCGAGGDVFNFVMCQKRISFPEALRYLAERKGIQVPLDNIDFQGEEKRRNINSALAEAAKVYHESLPSEVIGYLKSRGLTEETINSYRIGFCNGQSKYNSIQEILLNAGLIYEGGRNYFEGYITFPHLLYGRVVYMSGRGYPDKKHKKLEAEKVVLVYLYNEQALSQREVILAEGEIDTLTLIQHGFNACGVLGSNSFKDDWVDKFKNCETVYLSFDADEAGEKGSLKIAGLLGPKARLVYLPEGEDINDFFKHGTKEDYQKLLDQSLSLIEYKIKAIPKTTPPTRLPDVLDPILKELAQLNIAQADAILRHFIKTHFNLNSSEIETYAKLLRIYRKEPKETEIDRSLNKDEIIKILSNETALKETHPAQDCIDGKMHFAVKIQDEPYIVTSDRGLFSFDTAMQHGIIIKQDSVDTARFSYKGIKSFVNDNAEVEIGPLYRKIKGYIKRFIFFPSDSYPALISLWAMGTYLFMVFRYYPYIWLNAEKSSGKTLVMDVLSPILFNGELITNPTEAVIFRDVSRNLISMCIDEVEQLRKGDKDVYGALIRLLNVGFSKSAIVKRAEPSAQGSFILKDYRVYSPKMFAGINDIDDVLRDRTIRIQLWRKKESEVVERYKPTPKILEFQGEVRDELYIFALMYAGQIAQIYYENTTEILEGISHLSNRELDIWEPMILLANVVEQAGGEEDLVFKIEALSKELGKQKQEDSVSQNNTYQVLTVAKAMIDEVMPLSEEGNIAVFDSGKVFEFFKKSEEFGWIEKSNILTYRLRTINVRSEQRRFAGEKKRVYLFDKAWIKDLCERFHI